MKGEMNALKKKRNDTFNKKNANKKQVFPKKTKNFLTEIRNKPLI
jgi:hypothetical protein